MTMSKKNGKSGTLNGVCHFDSTDKAGGGDWAFQEIRYIKKNVRHGYCKKCGRPLGSQGVVGVERVEPLGAALRRGGKPDQRLDCPNNAHEEEIGDAWSYKGHHTLKNGDYLTIYSNNKDGKIVWRGVIKLRQYPLFTEGVFNNWINADQEGVERETWAHWFFEEYPATLVVA